MERTKSLKKERTQIRATMRMLVVQGRIDEENGLGEEPKTQAGAKAGR